MRILVPLPFDVSCLAHGRNLRIVHLLREMSRSNEITCVAVNQTLAERARTVLPGIGIVAADPRLAASAPDRPIGESSRRLDRAVRFFGYEAPLWVEIRRRSAQADAVLGFDLPSAVYLAAVQPGGPRVVLDLIDDPWLTLQSGRTMERFSSTGLKTAVAVAMIRRTLLPRFDVVTVVGPRDAASICRATRRPSPIVPNGVIVPKPPVAPAAREHLVVFTGAMNFPPNEAAAEHLIGRVWPLVKARMPIARLAIVGADPTRRVQRWSIVPSITVTGRVDDMTSWLQRARVATAPMISGCGMKNKVLEACAAACPVVATALGAAGLPQGKDVGILVADEPEAFAEAVVWLLKDPQAAERIGAAGLEMVRSRFSWSGAAQAMLGVLAGESAGLNDASPAARTAGCSLSGFQTADEEATRHAAS